MTTTLTRGRSATSEPCGCLAQTFVEGDARRPPEHTFGQRDVGLALGGVVDREGLIDDLRRGARDLEHLLRQLEDGELVGIADVDRSDVVAVEQSEEAAD